MRPPLNSYDKDQHQHVLYCPFAICLDNTKFAMPTKGSYERFYPIGAVIHYTAGNYKNADVDAYSAISNGIKHNYCYFCISATGTILQAFPLNKWGYHAGQSNYPNVGVGVSRHLVGIEICCAGLLSKREDGKFETWFKQPVPDDQVRYSKTDANIKEGHYHKYTDEQVAALSSLLIWLKWNNEEVFNLDFVLGHDEVAQRRKSDPGASLPYTMPEYRKILKDSYKKLAATTK